MRKLAFCSLEAYDYDTTSKQCNGVGVQWILVYFNGTPLHCYECLIGGWLCMVDRQVPLAMPTMINDNVA